MSLSKPIPLCRFCEAEKGKYMCPRCNIRYCSAKCYKDPAHERCTEMFFQEWVMSTLREQSAEEAEKQKMLQMLKDTFPADGPGEDDGDESINGDEPPIEERFQDLNLEGDVDEKQIWDRMSEKEKDRFKTMLKDESNLGEIIPIKKPWWSNKQLNLISESNDTVTASDDIAERPPLPIDIKNLSDITSRSPASTIQFNIVNILFAYVFLVKFHNFDLRELIEEVTDSILYLCPVLSQQKNYLSLDESVQDSIRLLTGSHFQVSVTHAKSLSADLCTLIDGPSNAPPPTFILCALNDLKMLLSEFMMISKTDKNSFSKTMKQTFQQVVKKLDFYLSWTVSHYDAELKPLAAQIQLQYVTEVVHDLADQNTSTDVPSEMKTDSSKVLIEELN